ncbi:MAG TPA: hypothetical protein VFK57_08045 [Vicinamibacterales bacterium]|nr:hypothetical protein [Vicinamibacterales bacterium]
MPARAILVLFLLSLTQDAPRPAADMPAADLFDAYLAGKQIDSAIARFVQTNGFVMDLRSAAYPWIDAAPPEARRRRLAVASAALEVAAADLRAREAQRALLPWAAALLTEHPPSDGERAWHRAANALVQRTRDAFLVNLPVQSLARFPDDDRLLLARLLAREQESWNVVKMQARAGDPGAAMLQSLAKDFEGLTSRRVVEAEARLRVGLTYLRLGRHADAWTQLARVEPLTGDRFLLYLSRYFSGRARLGMADVPGAAAAFASALELFPRAQSASFALAGILFRGPDRARAPGVVEAAVAGTDAAPDPWRTYQDGDYRFWPELVAQLRTQLR